MGSLELIMQNITDLIHIFIATLNASVRFLVEDMLWLELRRIRMSPCSMDLIETISSLHEPTPELDNCKFVWSLSYEIVQNSIFSSVNCEM